MPSKPKNNLRKAFTEEVPTAPVEEVPAVPVEEVPVEPAVPEEKAVAAQLPPKEKPYPFSFRAANGGPLPEYWVLPTKQIVTVGGATADAFAETLGVDAKGGTVKVLRTTRGELFRKKDCLLLTAE